MVNETPILDSDVPQARVSRIRQTDASTRPSLLHAVENALVAKSITTFPPQARSTGSGPDRLVELPPYPQHRRANGLEAVERHLDRLVAAVRQPGVPQVAKVLDGICDGCEGCPQHLMVCPLRDRGTCLMLRDADTILNAIARALRVANDPEYLQNHPVGP